MNEFLDIIGIALFSNWLIGWFEPIQSYRERLVEKMVNWIVRARIFWAQPLLTVFTCPMCLAFWASLIYTQNFLYALITSFLALLIYNEIKKTKDA